MNGLALAFVASALWLGTGHGVYRYEHGAWKLQTAHPAQAISAVDATHAWAIADQGQTMRTTDGVHWRVLGVQHLVALSFVGRRDGFALERDGIFLRTRDGGAHWTAPWGFRLQSICFADARTGWVAKGGTVWRTSDGGTRWRATRLFRKPDGNAAVASLACHGWNVWVTFTTGVAAGSEAYAIYRSGNGGATWWLAHAQFLGGAPTRRVDAYVGPVDAVSGAIEGWCPACGRGRVSVLVRGRRSSFDGWQPGPLAFADAKRGAVALTRGTTFKVFRTADGGRSWR